MRLWRDVGEAMTKAMRLQRRSDSIEIHMARLAEVLRVGRTSWFFVERP